MELTPVEKPNAVVCCALEVARQSPEHLPPRVVVVVVVDDDDDDDDAGCRMQFALCSII